MGMAIRQLVRVFFLTLCIFNLNTLHVLAEPATAAKPAPASAPAVQATPLPGEAHQELIETELSSSQNIFSRSLSAGPMVFMVLLLLVSLSILSWAILFGKTVYLKRLNDQNDKFIKIFWESRSLNDLNAKLHDYPFSPAKEVFRSAYAELVRGSQLKDQSISPEWAIHAAIENLNRTLAKSKTAQRRDMEKYLSLLAITASVSPFIGLFGTVWGIMSSFDMIAKTGSTSLASVAPGISEALIATAFGLAAAIPSVIGYNFINNKVRSIVGHLDGFGADFLNIVERYLVSDRSKNSSTQPSSTQTPRI